MSINTEVIYRKFRFVFLMVLLHANVRGQMITPDYLFIIAHGTGGNAEGHLFNINWFTFTK